MKISEARKRIGQLVLSFHGVPAGGAPLGPFTLSYVDKNGLCYFKGDWMPKAEAHPAADLVLNETWPVDFDDPADPDCPKTGGIAALAAVMHAGCIESVDALPEANIIIWKEDAGAALEKRLFAMGWSITRTRPWKK